MTLTDARPKLTLESFTPATALRGRKGLNLLVYGAPGAGKTTFAASGPAPLIVDMEGGTYSVADRADVQVFRATTWDDLTALYGFVRTPGHPFGTIVLDSITEAYRLALDLAVREDPKAQPGAGPQLHHHGAATERIIKMARAYRDLANDRGLHVVFTAPEVLKAEQSESEDKGRLIRRPSLPPRALEGIRESVDGVVRLQPTKDGGRVLTLRTPNPLVMAKFRAPADVAVPDRLDNPTIPALLTLLRKDR